MPKTIYDIDDILKILPHRDPFLFITRIVRFKPGKMIVGEYDIPMDLIHFKGHFPGHPIMPGALITDSCAQTSGLLWGFTKQVKEEAEGKTKDDSKPELFYLAADSMKYVEPALPGETLTISVTAGDAFGALFKYKVEATVKRRVIAKGVLTLAVKDQD
jgi:3-hydroxymyristoyl/3-hydroxydecanoyl-(acyl carrier protein) dehydratase